MAAITELESGVNPHKESPLKTCHRATIVENFNLRRRFCMYLLMYVCFLELLSALFPNHLDLILI